MMAALSCYQPCRSHLAQPARCYNDDEGHKSAATLSLRRRQFAEQCHEPRGARRGDPIPEVSVRRTREELAKHAAQTLPLNRRLNVESGWSKVEEVRKKFEGASTVPSYSRSFESPPRRRLADSLFASFKLPRKKDIMSAPRPLAPQPQQKRKSAVELLAESKPFYVKSEMVLDRKQELPMRVSSSLGQAIAAGGCHLVSSGAHNNDQFCRTYAPPRNTGATRRAASAGEGLQDTLRRLLDISDSRESVYSPTDNQQSQTYEEPRQVKDTYPKREYSSRAEHSSRVDHSSRAEHSSRVDHISRAEHCRTEHSRAEHCRTEHSRAEHCRTDHCRTEHCRTEHIPRADHFSRTEYASRAEHASRSEHLSRADHSSRVNHSSRVEHISRTDHASRAEHIPRAERSSRSEHSSRTEHISRAEISIRMEHISRSHTAGTYSGTSSSSKSSKARVDAAKNIRALSYGDARVFFPETFVIPRQRASEVVVKKPYSLPSSQSSPEQMELPDPIASGSGSPQYHVGAISPPAQYAYSAPRYVRSHSHSQPSVRGEEDSLNFNSHKSLPDLHTQAHGYTEHGNTGAAEAVVGSMSRSPRRRRHSTHQRAASCSSKGTSRCGSAFARDSGGSSGHYTQRSAPPHARRRTDSGSSTQHEHSHYNSYGEEAACLPLDVYPSAPPQFQDGAPSPPPPAPRSTGHSPARVGIHFQASAPPPQFQDDPPVYDYGDYERTYKSPARCHGGAVRRDHSRHHESLQPRAGQEARRSRADQNQEHANAGQVCEVCPQEEVTSPLGTFKRQRCLRYKRPRPIMRSKSDISDSGMPILPIGFGTSTNIPRAYSSSSSPPSSSYEEDRPTRGVPPPIQVTTLAYRKSPTGDECGVSAAAAIILQINAEEERKLKPEEVARLKEFFEKMGLEGHELEAIARDLSPDSPVFFSSASTVDSNQLAAAADYTVQGPGAPRQAYRNTEPPSVVERNARIIKWLCQCRRILGLPQE